MKKLFTNKAILSILVIGTLVSAFVAGLALRSASGAHAAGPKASSASNAFCSRLGKSIGGSSGAWTYCFGPQSANASHVNTSSGTSFGPNVDAANLQEDITPNGTRAYGQSETSIAGNATYVVEAWNDSTGFFAPCPSPMFKEELTGYGFSANAGTSDIAMDACTATGSGSSATISCKGPFIIATGGPGDFLDKDFLSIDPARGRLYASYDRFGATGLAANGQVELAVCDLSTPATPVCYPGASTAPYLIVQPAQVCENEGAYPAVDIKRGDVYVAWEYNWATNFLGPAPCNTTEPLQNRVAYVPFTCLTLTPVSPCGTTPKQVSVNIVSIDTAFIPGFNRTPSSAAPANDFPRIAVSDPYGTVTIVWNDTRYHPLGDILLQSYKLVSLGPVQSNPVRINPDTGGMHLMPALRQAQSSGLLDISYYQRDTANTDSTNVDAVLNLSPKTTGAGNKIRVTNVPSAWIDTSSDIIPNFGDYTDNYVQALSQAPYYNDTLYVAWSDGRLGEPQPFEAHGVS